MTQERNNTVGYNRRSRCRAVLALALCAGVLAGCSSVPDAVNPVEWYRGTRDWIAGTDEPAAAESKAAPKPSTAEGKEFPRLDTVPPRPQPPTAAERNQLARTLAADREEARYSDEIIRRQTDSTGKMTETRPPPPPAMLQVNEAAPPPAPAAAPAPAPAPAPSAVPRMEPPPAPRAVAPSAVPPLPAAPAAAPPPAPFPPMPAAPPVPSRTAAAVPPMPVAPPPMAPLRMAPPPMPRPVAPARSPAAPPASAAASPMGPGGPVFGPVPSDIALNMGRPAAPRAGGGRPFTPAQTFSPRFPAGTGGAPQSFAAATQQKLGTVRFGVGSARLSNSARAALRRIAQTIKQSGARVRVVGHASSRTRDMEPVQHHLANFQVSLDRANAVARELRRRGVNPAAITVEAVSDTDPVFIEVMPAGEAANRRVEILIEN